MRILAALSQKHIRALWIGLVLSAIGDTLYSIATVWIAVEAVGSSAGIVAATQSAATLLLAPFGGVLADREDRRRMMIAADLARAVVVATLPIASYFAPIHLGHLIVVALGLGSLNAMFTPALQASLPSLTRGTEELQATNALMDTTFRIARAVGPSLAGVLAATISIPHFFTLDAVSFIASAFAIVTLGRGFEWRGAAGSVPARGLIAEVIGAVRVVRENPMMSYAMVGSFIVNAAWCCGFTVGGALFAQRVLASDVGAYGFMVGAYGAGNIASNLIAGNFTPKNRVPMLFGGTVILGIGFLGLAFAPTLHWAMAASALAATGGPLGTLAMVTMIQTDFPRDQIGKAISLRMVVEYGGVSAGLILAAPIFAVLPVRVGIAVSALSMAVYGLSGLYRFRGGTSRFAGRSDVTL